MSPLETSATVPALIPLPLTISAALIFASLDAFDWTSYGPPFRYALVGIVLLITLSVDASTLRVTHHLNALVTVLALLYACWLVCVVMSAIVEGTWSPDTLVIVAAASTLGSAPLIFSLVPARPRQRFSAASQRILFLSSMVFALASIFNGLVAQEGVPVSLLNHEKAFIAIVVLSLPRSRGIRIVKILTVIAILISLARYPTATMAIVLIIAAFTRLLLSRRSRKFTLLAATIVFGMALALAPRADDVLRGFYFLVGRTDNSGTRLHLWDQALTVLSINPVIGGHGTQPITALGNIRGIIQPVPFHNAFLTLAVFGGLIAVVLFGFLVITVLLRGLLSSREARRRAVIWLPALFAAVATLTVNPVLDKLGTAVPFYILVVCGMIIETTREQGRSSPLGHAPEYKLGPRNAICASET